MTAIHRFEIPIEDYLEIKVPASHAILSVAPARTHYMRRTSRGTLEETQGIDLWARVSPSHNTYTVAVWVIGTGEEFPRHRRNGGDKFGEMDFVGTCVMNSGLVWHVFAQSLGVVVDD